MSKEMDTMIAAALLKLLQKEGVREKAVGASSFTPGHGSTGTFSQPGLSPEVANAMVMPELGLQTILPVRATRETNPLHAIFTGVTNLSDGNKPNGPCDDGITPGLAKLCTQTYVLGRQVMQTPVVDVTRVGQIVNRGEFTDFRLIGGPDFGQPAPSVPADIGAAMRTELDKIMLEFRVSWAREFSKTIYTGNPTNNSAGGGYKEFRGLDILINTGYRDAETGTACPAADSFIRNFSNANISTTASAATEILNQMTAIYRYLRALARQTGLNPVRWALVMPEMLHYELTKLWPISYLTTGATLVAAGQTNTQLAVDAGSQVALRDGMRNGQYLMMDGVQVPVIFDDAVARSNTNGTFTSPVYFVPLTVLGGTPATYMEYFDWSAPGAAIDVIRALGIDGAFTVTDGGRYLWVKKPQNNFCVQSQVVESSRLRLDFPFLAARITNINYTPIIGTRSPYPSDPDFYNGGKTNRANYAPSFWSPNTAG